LKSEIAEVVKQVAAKLRNTPAAWQVLYQPGGIRFMAFGRHSPGLQRSLSLAAPREAETLVLAFCAMKPNRRTHANA
jgi:hypothetical protein